MVLGRKPPETHPTQILYGFWPRFSLRRAVCLSSWNSALKVPTFWFCANFAHGPGRITFFACRISLQSIDNRNHSTECAHATEVPLGLAARPGTVTIQVSFRVFFVFWYCKVPCQATRGVVQCCANVSRCCSDLCGVVRR